MATAPTVATTQAQRRGLLMSMTGNDHFSKPRTVQMQRIEPRAVSQI